MNKYNIRKVSYSTGNGDEIITQNVGVLLQTTTHISKGDRALMRRN